MTGSAAPRCSLAKEAAGDAASRRVSGTRLKTDLRRFAVGERAGKVAGELFEEVAAVIEGGFHVSAAGEEYDLVAGEGIIIPPGEPREWLCTDGPGVLYRVHAPGESPS